MIELYFHLIKKNIPATILGKDIEKGLNKLIGRINDYSVEDGLEKLKEFQQELKEYALTKTLRGHVNMDRYVEETEKIRRQIEDKREDAILRGLLPRD